MISMTINEFLREGMISIMAYKEIARENVAEKLNSDETHLFKSEADLFTLFPNYRFPCTFSIGTRKTITGKVNLLFTFQTFYAIN